MMSLKNVSKLDYMMKLRAEEFKEATSSFHVNMSKGTSAHVFCHTHRLTSQEEVARKLPNSDAQVGDYAMTYVDSFGSNTAQGGYETLCVEEAALRELKRQNPDLEETAFCMDAGSGYKTAQNLLGLRNSKELTGVWVKHVHFNASGEGKRWKTDGHNPAIKARRKEAMKAGKPAACTTPESEVLAQHFQGGSPGTFPFVLEFDYNKEAKMKQWDGIQAWHDFEYDDKGGITVWKAYKIGPGKYFAKDKLDRKYETPCAGGFPQGTTGSRFIDIKEAVDGADVEAPTVRVDEAPATNRAPVDGANEPAMKRPKLEQSSRRKQEKRKQNAEKAEEAARV
jgi:hypothetical protein